jgi:hypothetical protein
VYDNRRIAKGQTTRTINEAEAAIVRDIWTRYAGGEGGRMIALALNRAGAPSPRSQQQRPEAWSASTIKAILDRPLGKYLLSGASLSPRRVTGISRR